MNRILCYLCRDRRSKDNLPDFCSKHLLPIDLCRRSCGRCQIDSPIGVITISKNKI